MKVFLFRILMVVLLQILVRTTGTVCNGVHECRCNQITDQTIDVMCDVTNIHTTLTAVTDSVSHLSISCVTDDLQQMTSATFHKFKNLTSLSFHRCSISSSYPAIFNDLNISNLKFRRCDLHNVTYEFSISLKSLEISDSGLTVFPEIGYLTHLQSLNVSSNNLKNYGGLDSICAEEIHSLLHIDLSNNSLVRLPNITDCSVNLISLHMTNNPPLHISDNYFTHFTGLQVLDMQSTFLIGNLSSIGHLRNLTVLNVHGVGQPLEVSMQTFTSLTYLNLQNVAMDTEIISDMDPMNELVTLKLVSCNISEVLKTSFQNLSRLEVLDISGNILEFIRPGTFDNQVHLQRLNLSHNKIQSVYSETLTPTTLKEVDLSCNEISFVSGEAFTKPTNLVRLNISCNNIPHLSATTFQGLGSLEELFLNHNELNTLPSFMSQGNLKYLDLKNNQLENLKDDSFYGLKSLIGISLRNNSITFLSSTAFRDSYSMTYLDVAYNSIQTIEKHHFYPTPWGNLSQLNFLRLDFNQIRYLTDELSTFNKLQQIFLGHNELTKITHDMFPKSLLGLELSYNKISYIGRLFSKLQQLLTLVLVFNYPYLRTLHLNTFWMGAKYRPRAKVFIGFNEFNCDCNMQWLKTLTIPGQEIVKPLRNLPEFPDAHATFCVNSGPGLTKLLDYPVHEFVCVYEHENFECLLDCACCYNVGIQECPCAYWCPPGCICYKSLNMFWKNEVVCQNRNLTAIPPSLPPDATHINLSGNDILVVNNNSFSTLDYLKHLYLNNTGLTLLTRGCFNHLSGLISLHLDHNYLRLLPSDVFNHLNGLHQLFLHHNHIITLSPDVFHNLHMLQTLTLHNNWLNGVKALKSMENLTMVGLTLSDNNWSCDCEFMDDFIDFVTVYSQRIVDVTSLFCTSTDTNSTCIQSISGIQSIRVLDFDFYLICSNKTIVLNTTIVEHVLVMDKRLLGTIISLSLLCVALLLCGVLLVWKRRFVLVVIYNKFGVRLLHEAKTDEQDYKYDAFVSYNSKDEDFVVHELMPRLEVDKNFKLCLHFRDFSVGEYIADNIVEAVDSSRRTILIISNNYLASEWCKFEFQTANHVMITDHADSLVVILKEKINHDLLDPDLKLLLKTRTYVEYGDPWFWEKLYFALPNQDKPKTDEIVNNDIKGEVEIHMVEHKM